MVKRTFLPVVLGLLLAVAAAQSVAAVPGAAPSFAVSPASLSFSGPAGTAAYAMVTVSTKKSIALANPATSTDGRFVDTQAGSCWQQYGALGLKVPMKTSCTIEVRFLSPMAGTFTGTLAVSECLKWHLDAQGGIACDTAGAAESVALTGTAIAGLPDLAVLGIVIDNVGPTGDAAYRVDVANFGSSTVEPGVYVEGWWSRDDVLDGDDQGACNGLTTGPIAPSGVTPVFITCPNKPSSAHQFVIVELDHGNVVEESDETNNFGIAPLPPH